MYVRDELRGCIGHIAEDKPLWKVIRDMAVSAAIQDPRFQPVTKEELDQVRFEISLLSSFTEITDFSKIKVGTHGLFIQIGNTRGLLLPQVATRFGWTAKQFLRETCMKANLPEDAYTWDDTQVLTFTAKVITE